MLHSYFVEKTVNATNQVMSTNCMTGQPVEVTVSPHQVINDDISF